MRDHLLIGVAAIGFTAAVIVLVSLTRTTPLPEVTPRILASEPDFYAGKTVAIKVAGIEETGDPLVFIFRKQTATPPVVVFRFKSQPPNPLPASIIGICQGRSNGHVLVTDCQ